MRWRDLPPRGTSPGGRQNPLAGAGRYEYRGIPGWDPAALGPMEVPVYTGSRARPEAAQAASAAKRAAAREARLSLFARLRAEGLDVKEAAAAVGVSLVTAKDYERERRAREAGAR